MKNPGKEKSHVNIQTQKDKGQCYILLTIDRNIYIVT